MIFLKENILTMIVAVSLLIFGITGILNTSAQTETNNTQTLYNTDLNPRQIEYSAILGFNDLHIEAINHLNPNMTSSLIKMYVR